MRFSNWSALFAISGFVLAVVGAFLVPPPFNENVVLPFSKYLIAILIGLILIPASIYKERTNLTLWVCLTVALLVIGTTDVVAYSRNEDKHTQMYAERRVVTGSNLLPAAKVALDRLTHHGKVPVSDADLIGTAGGKVDTIWPQSEITWNGELLEMQYVIGSVCFGLAIVTLLQGFAVANVSIPTAPGPQGRTDQANE